jgi:hypothetical protein
MQPTTTPAAIFLIAIANVSPGDLIEQARAAGLSGTCIPGAVGFTPEWGTEGTTVLRIATRDRPAVIAYITAALQRHEEQAAYVEDPAAGAGLLWADGTFQAL